LLGHGRYTDDISLPGQAHGYVLRSPHAHARITALDVTDAKAMPGVLGIITGAELQAQGIGEVPCAIPLKNSDGTSRADTPRLPLATDTVRHVGDPVAFVCETVQQARDAAEAIAVTTTSWTASPTSPWRTSRASRSSGRRAQQHLLRLGSRRQGEGRAELIGSRPCDAADRGEQPRHGRLDGRRACGPSTTRLRALHPPRRHAGLLAGQEPAGGNVLKVDPSLVRVVTPDVGGGFGMKLYLYAEYALCALAGPAVRRPVKWAAERTEAFVSDTHGRDNITLGELALDKDGKFLALRTRNHANMGAYLSTFAPFIPTGAGTKVLASVYNFQAIHARVLGVLTNTVPVDAYRGAGRPESNYLVERLIDQAARDIGVDRIELRRRNMVQQSAMPYMTAMSQRYDSGDFPRVMDAALSKIDWAGFPARQAEAARRGKQRGIGLAYYLEATGGGRPRTPR
jgi:carbon-monoxide dehydrogenase large subunit